MAITPRYPAPHNPREMPETREGPPPVQVVRADSSFSEDFAGFCSALSALAPPPDGRRKRQYATVSIFGAQSSGKSTLLNDMLGTGFDVLDERDGRRQTTQGVWAAAVADSPAPEPGSPSPEEGPEQLRQTRREPIESGALGASPLRPAALLLLDCEGADSRERTILHAQSIENRIASFAAAVSDVLLLNLWETDIGRYNAANYNTLSSVFGIYFKSLIASRSAGSRLRLLFVVRDARETEGPAADKISEMLVSDVVKIYRDVVGDGSFDPAAALAALAAEEGERSPQDYTGPQGPAEPHDPAAPAGGHHPDLRDCFDRFFQVDVCYIPHRRYEPQGYAAGVERLRERLLALQNEPADPPAAPGERGARRPVGRPARPAERCGAAGTPAGSSAPGEPGETGEPGQAAASAESADPATPVVLASPRDAEGGPAGGPGSGTPGSPPGALPALPIDALPEFYSRVWEIIVSNRELDIVTQREIVSRSRCNEIAREVVEEARVAMDEIRDYITGAQASQLSLARTSAADGRYGPGEGASSCSLSVSMASTSGGRGPGGPGPAGGAPWGEGVSRAGPASRSMLLASPIDARRSSRGRASYPADSSLIARGIAQASTVEADSRAQRSLLGDRSLDRSVCERGRRDSRYGLRPAALQPPSINPHGVVSSLLSVRREALQRYAERTARYQRSYAQGGRQFVDNECQIAVHELCGLLLERMDAYVAGMLRTLNAEAEQALAEAISRWGGRGGQEDALPYFLENEKAPGFFCFQTLLKILAEAAEAYKHEKEYAREIAAFLEPLEEGGGREGGRNGVHGGSHAGASSAPGAGPAGDPAEGFSGSPSLSASSSPSDAPSSPGALNMLGVRSVMLRNNALLSRALGLEREGGGCGSSRGSSHGDGRAPDAPDAPPRCAAWRDVFRTRDYFSVIRLINDAAFFCLATWTEPLCRGVGYAQFADGSRAACLQAGYEKITAVTSQTADLLAEAVGRPLLAEARQRAAVALHAVPADPYAALEALREELVRERAAQLERASAEALRAGPPEPFAGPAGAGGALSASLDVSALDPAVELPGRGGGRAGLAGLGASGADPAGAGLPPSAESDSEPEFSPEPAAETRVWCLEHPGEACPAHLIPLGAFVRQMDYGVAKCISGAIAEFVRVSLGDTLHGEFRRRFLTAPGASGAAGAPRVWDRGDDVEGAYAAAAGALRSFAMSLLAGDLAPARGACVVSCRGPEAGGEGDAEGAGAPGPIVVYPFPTISLCALSDREDLAMRVREGADAGAGSPRPQTPDPALRAECDRLEPTIQRVLERSEEAWRGYYEQAVRDRDARAAASGSLRGVPWQVWLLVLFLARHDIRALLQSKLFVTLALLAVISVFLFLQLSGCSLSDLCQACRAAGGVVTRCLAAGDVQGLRGALDPLRNLLGPSPAGEPAGRAE